MRSVLDAPTKLPFVYRIDVQQGNTIRQSMLDKLEPEMSKEKVAFIMGYPLLVDPFHNNRWEYIESTTSSLGERYQRRVTLFFVDNKLTHIAGDTITEERQSKEDSTRNLNIQLSPTGKKESFFKRLFKKDKLQDEKTESAAELAETQAITTQEETNIQDAQ